MVDAPKIAEDREASMFTFDLLDPLFVFPYPAPEFEEYKDPELMVSLKLMPIRVMPPMMFGLSPNITGGFTLDVISVGRFGIDNAQGAFTASDPYDILFDPGASQGEQYTRAEFSAASSNAIYSGSSVHPPALLLLPCIKV